MMLKFSAIALAGVLALGGLAPASQAFAQSGTTTNSGSARPDAHANQGGGSGAASQGAVTPQGGSGAGEGAPTQPTATQNTGGQRPDTSLMKDTKKHHGGAHTPKKPTATQNQ